MASQSGGSASSAQGGASSNKLLIGIAAAAVLAIALVLGIVLTGSSDDDAAADGDDEVSSEANIPEERDGVVAVQGNEDADVTIDVYADYLCPACQQFEEAFGEQIEEYVEAGQLQVRNYLVPMLAERSNPQGYSLDAANAAVCAADEEEFTPYHQTLFAEQPGPNDVYGTGELVELGQDLGITGEQFTTCVTEGTYNQQLQAQFQEISTDESLHQDVGDGPGFSTPTVVHDGNIVPVSEDGEWLTRLVEEHESA